MSASTERLLLKEDLARFAQCGLRIDRRQLKENMTRQFADPREWIREYVVNACDAGATRVWVGGRESGDVITVSVVDDGHGMTMGELRDFLTLYRSRKRLDGAVGSHGIGKLSVAAVPGQCAFELVTSTGEEAWRVEAGALLEESEIRVEPVEAGTARGTRVEVAFRKESMEQTVARELRRLREVLVRYVRFVSAEVLVETERDRKLVPVRINEDWIGSLRALGRRFETEVAGARCEVLLGIGRGAHELYQRRVLVSSGYDLLTAGLEGARRPPYLAVRADLPEVELPFGRHAVRDETIVDRLAKQIRRELLPAYMRYVYERLEDAEEELGEEVRRQVDAITVALLEIDDGDRAVWAHAPVFVDAMRNRYSYRDLREAASDGGAVFLQPASVAGIDYEAFKAPVLAPDQGEGAFHLLKEKLGEQLVDLEVDDLVLEAAPSIKEVGARERRLMEGLRFDARSWLERLAEMEEERSPRRKDAEGPRGGRQGGDLQGAIEEICALSWRVGYLVQGDGRTPAAAQKFIERGGTIILNLHHPEVEKLVALSERAPGLAGHWALGMVLGAAGEHGLEGVPPAVREQIIMADAIARCGEESGEGSGLLAAPLARMGGGR